MNFKSVSAFCAGALLGALVVIGILRRDESRFGKNDLAQRHQSNAQTSSISATRPTIASGEREGPKAVDQETENRAGANDRKIMARLITLKSLSGGSVHDRRALISELEALRQVGPSALPAIREFLAGGDDFDIESGAGKGGRNGKVPLEFLVPPSLRLGLLEVVKDIGGEESQQLLGKELNASGRGIEIAYLASALQQLSGDKYRDAAVRAARDLLAMPALPATSSGAIDSRDRDYLYDTLTSLKDTSYVAQAQSEVLRADGSIDRTSLRYLQNALGEQSVDVAQKLWENPAVAADKKGPIAQVALSYVGVNAQAEQLFLTAIDGSSLKPDTRRNLIEDLNQTGFPDTKNLTTADLPMIEKRLSLIDTSLPATTDAINTAAFKEARKDLLAMRARILNQAKH